MQTSTEVLERIQRLPLRQRFAVPAIAVSLMAAPCASTASSAVEPATGVTHDGKRWIYAVYEN